MQKFEQYCDLILMNEFDGQYEKRDIIKDYLLIDQLLYGISKSSLVNDISLKGGGNLQKIYQSYRYTRDLDFSCSRHPKFSDKEFIEFGYEFVSFFKKYLKESYDIPSEHISVEKPSTEKISSFFSNSNRKINERKVAKWVLLVDTNQETNSSRNVRFLQSRIVSPKKIRRLKVEIANVDSYTNQQQTFSPNFFSYSPKLINAESMQEIFIEKMLSLYTRKTFKYTDLYDILFIEQRNCVPSPSDFQDIFIKKIYDQGFHEKIVRQIARKNLTYVENNNINKEAFLQNLSICIPNVTFNSLLSNISHLFLFFKSRMTHYLYSIDSANYKNFKNMEIVSFNDFFSNVEKKQENNIYIENNTNFDPNF